MKDLPLVSIIIPCYNGEAFVAEAIQSALDQTYPNKEVIVIDDGSTDGTLDVIKSFGDKIRWEAGPNRGGSAARNRGIELARGELIQFLDADDLLHPQKLERQLDVIRENQGAIVYCDFAVQNIETGEILEIPRRECVGQDNVCFAIMGERISISAPLYQRTWLSEVGGFDEQLPCAQEYDLNIRLACQGRKWFHLHEVLYVVRRRETSVSSDYVRILRHHEIILLRAKRILEDRGELTDQRAEAIAGKLASDARNFLRFGQPKEARRFFRIARSVHSSGGLSLAYSQSTRTLLKVVGPWLTEKLVRVKRSARGPKNYPGDQVL